MGSPTSGNCSLQSCEENQHVQTEMRKRKRMLSNRESARRSRMRKQKLLDDLTAQANNLRAENNHILTNINLVTHLYSNIDSQNSLLRAQMSELNHRLHALNEIITCFTAELPPASATGLLEDHGSDYNDDLLNPWNFIHLNQPIMASPDVFFY